jgi:hypothetical protein
MRFSPFFLAAPLPYVGALSGGTIAADGRTHRRAIEPRRHTLSVLLLLLLAAFLFGGVSIGSSTHPTVHRGAGLRIADTSPMTVAGMRFAPGERVRVTVVAQGRKVVRRTVASEEGRFTVRFRFSVDRCTAPIAYAVGSRGTRAFAKLPLPECAPR